MDFEMNLQLGRPVHFHGQLPIISLFSFITERQVQKTKTYNYLVYEWLLYLQYKVERKLRIFRKSLERIRPDHYDIDTFPNVWNFGRDDNFRYSL